MKNYIVLLIAFLPFLSLDTQAQTSGFNYQAVIRNWDETPVKNQPVTLRFGILSSPTQDPNAAYTETITLATNQFGMVDTVIGKGNPSNFDTIQWNAGKRYLQVAMLVGGTFQSLGDAKEIVHPPFAGGNSTWTVNGGNIYRETGNVGIGTKSPIAPLHIKASDPDIILDFNENPQANLAEIRFSNNGETGAQFLWDRITNNVQLSYDNLGSGLGDFHILRNGEARMTIKNGGNVGIGRINPDTKLEIDGDLHLDGNARIYFQGGPNDPNYIIESYPLPGSAGMRMKGHGGVKLADATGDVISILEGNVGIGTGTLTPQYKLDINGSTRTKCLTITGGCDITEPFPNAKNETLAPGSVVVIDEENPGMIRLATSAYDTKVAGVISGAGDVKPGLSLSQAGVLDNGQQMALAGRVYVRVSASNGPIRPGDMLTTSDLSGVAMKATDPARSHGTVLGKAMSRLESGEGLVLVLVGLQ